MKYTLTITSDDQQELISLLSGLSGETANAAPAKKIKAAAIKPEPPAEEDDLIGGGNYEEEVTLEQLQKDVAAKAQGGLRDKVKKLLTKYGASKLSELDEDKFVAFKSELDKIK